MIERTFKLYLNGTGELLRSEFYAHEVENDK